MARRIVGERMVWATGLHKLLRAGVAGLGGDAELTERLLRESIGALDKADLGLHAMAARARLAKLLGGDEGARLAADGQSWASRHGVKNFPSLIRIHAAGFGE